MKLKSDTNRFHATGRIISEFYFSHSLKGKEYYAFKLEIGRVSKATDILPVVITKDMLDITQDQSGQETEVFGEFHSLLKKQENGCRLILAVRAREIRLGSKTHTLDRNEIFLEGHICQEPVFRVTPFGRQITDLMLAVERPASRHVDYIPCILWGKQARAASGFYPGMEIQLWGRVQSRVYKKQEGSARQEHKVYEVSASCFALCEL